MATFNDARVSSRPADAAPLAGDRPVNRGGKYVLYWCQMARRLRANHALDYALHWATKLKKPLVVYEGLKLDYPWASARFHRFLLEGMRDNAADAAAMGLNYWPFVETPAHPGRGLVRTLAKDACLVVTDDYPQFIVPAQTAALAAAVEVPVYAVDGNGMIPLGKLGTTVSAAAHLRPRIHKLFAEAWQHRAAAEPHLTPATQARVDPPFEPWTVPKDLPAFVRSLPVDQSVPAVSTAVGGRAAGERVLAEFVESKLPRYAAERNRPDDPAQNSASGLSYYLHYGHLGIQQVCDTVLGPDWTVDDLNPTTRNKDDFFCRDENANGFLDEAITWRDIGYHFCWNAHRAATASQGTRSRQEPGEVPSFNFASFDFSPVDPAGTLDRVLPAWAKATLAKHAGDRREHLYSLAEFEAAATHDDLWNAAQTELVRTGRIHNYLRMLWAKKVLEWSATPAEAYRVLEHLNNKYAIDGRDPNSYTGIFWCFGLFDRPWAPERSVFGSVRYMSSDNTGRKFKLGAYRDYVAGLTPPPP